MKECIFTTNKLMLRIKIKALWFILTILLDVFKLRFAVCHLMRSLHDILEKEVHLPYCITESVFYK